MITLGVTYSLLLSENLCLVLSKLVFFFFFFFSMKNYETVDRTDPSARAQGEKRAQEENEERLSELRDKMEKDRALALREAKARALNEDGAQRMRLEKQRREREENARRLKEEEAFLQLKRELMMYDFHIRPRIRKESFTGLQVDDVDLIRIALIGPTGSGKTSFIGKYKFYLFESTINCFQMLSSRMANIIGLVKTLVGFYHH